MLRTKTRTKQMRQRFFTARTDEGWFLGRTRGKNEDEAPEVIGPFKTKTHALTIQKFIQIKFIQNDEFTSLQDSYDWLANDIITALTSKGCDPVQALHFADNALYGNKR